MTGLDVGDQRSRSHLGSSSNTWVFGHTRISPKWYLDWFGWFCRACKCDQQTDRQTMSLLL